MIRAVDFGLVMRGHRIDFFTSWLHYRLTVIALLSFSMLGPVWDLVGNTISCDPIQGIQDDSVYDYCKVFPGFDVYAQEQENAVKSFGHYVLMTVLFISGAALFYIPRLLWVTCENGIMRKITSRLRHPMVNRENKIRFLVQYVKNNIGKHGCYIAMYMVSQIIYGLNVFLQMCFYHLFMGGKILGHGFDFVQMKLDFNITGSQIERIFPVKTNCSYTESDGTRFFQTHSTLCRWNVNVWNETFCIMIQCWLYVLALMTFMSLVRDFIFIASKHARIYVLTKKMDPARVPGIVHFVQTKGGLGDYFLFYLLYKNLNKSVFYEFMRKLSDRASSLELQEFYAHLEEENDRENCG